MLSEALKLIREFHDLNQADLAARLQVSRSFLSELEAGKKSPSLDILERYATTFKIPKSSLFLFAEALEQRPIGSKPKAKVADKILRIMRWIAAKEEE